MEDKMKMMHEVDAMENLVIDSLGEAEALGAILREMKYEQKKEILSRIIKFYALDK